MISATGVHTRGQLTGEGITTIESSRTTTGTTGTGLTGSGVGTGTGTGTGLTGGGELENAAVEYNPRSEDVSLKK